MNEYYTVILYNCLFELYLLEQKELKIGEYTPWKSWRKKGYYEYLREVIDSIGAGEFCVSYQNYRLYKSDYYSVNDFYKDGFSYNEQSKIVNYGFTYIYAEFSNGNYYELISGQVLLESAGHRFLKVDGLERLRKMRIQLEFISKHLELYSKNLEYAFEKLSLSQENYRIAYQLYLKKWKEYCKKKDEMDYKNNLENHLWRFQQQDYLQEEEKVQTILKKIRGF